MLLWLEKKETCLITNMKNKWSKITIDFYTTADIKNVHWMEFANLFSIELQKKPYLLNHFKVYINAELKIKPNKKWWKFWQAELQTIL